MTSSKNKAESAKRAAKGATAKRKKAGRLPIDLDYPDHEVPGRLSRDAEFARRALKAIPELDDEQLAELQERITSGYYRNSSVVAALSETIAKVLSKRPDSD